MKILANITPQPGVQQKIVLLLNEVLTGSTGTPRFYRFEATPGVVPPEIPISGVEAGDYIVRLLVDEVESVFLDPATKKPRNLIKRIEAIPSTQKRLRATNIQLSFSGEGSAATVRSEVTVQDQNNAPVADVQASATWNAPDGSAPNQAQPTNAGGIASFTHNDGRGTYTFNLNNLSKSGYTFDRSNSITRKTIVVPALNVLRATQISFEVTPQNNQFEVRGRVTVLDSNQNPVAGANVSVNWRLPNNTTPPQTASTNSQGVALFTVTNGSGTYTLNVTNVTKTDFTFDSANSVLTNSVVAPGEPLRVDQIYYPGDFDKGDHLEIRWEVTIKDRTGARIEGASVTVRLTFPDGSSRMETDPHTNEHGHAVFEVNTQLRGTFTLTVTEVAKPGYYFDQAGSTELTKTLAAESNPLNVESISFEGVQYDDPLRVPGRVIVKDKTAAAVQNAFVEARWTLPDGSTEDQSDSTNELGYAWLEITGPRGLYTLTVLNITKAGYTFDPTQNIVSHTRVL